MIADINPSNRGTNLLDDARPLVPEDNRPVAGKMTLAEQEVSMADARSGNLYENLADPDFGEPDFLNGKGFITPAKDRCARRLHRSNHFRVDRQVLQSADEERPDQLRLAGQLNIA